VAGNARIIVTVPHGGCEEPAFISDRVAPPGLKISTVTDSYTIEVGRRFVDRLAHEL